VNFETLSGIAHLRVAAPDDFSAGRDAVDLVSCAFFKAGVDACKVCCGVARIEAQDAGRGDIEAGVCLKQADG